MQEIIIYDIQYVFLLSGQINRYVTHNNFDNKLIVSL